MSGDSGSPDFTDLTSQEEVTVVFAEAAQVVFG
jgi:hypothetical protein